MTSKKWIQTLNLAPHPEGGFYRETYHADTYVDDEVTLGTHGGPRRTATSIYFLLERQDKSRFHRLKSDEIWYFHTGSALTVHVISIAGEYSTHLLGLNSDCGESPQLLIPKGSIFGATIEDAKEDDAFALVSCMVSPGFDFADFELFETEPLVRQYPRFKEIIMRLTTPVEQS